MSTYFEYLIKTGEEGAYNITEQVRKAITESEVINGIAFIYCPHTTAGITITENADPNVTADMLLGLEKSLPDRPEFKHSEGNSFAHIKSSIMGCQMQIIVDERWPVLGPWQAIYFFEFDGPRERRFFVKVIEC